VSDPKLPPEPFTEYAQYMIDRVDSLNMVVMVLLTISALSVLTFAAFALQKYWERLDIREWRAEVVRFTQATNTLLIAIKGWTVVHIDEERRKAATATEVVEKAKEEIKAFVPEATAAAVMGSLNAQGSLDGTGLPAVGSGISKKKPPPGG
jgi:hypothetical protein